MGAHFAPRGIRGNEDAHAHGNDDGNEDAHAHAHAHEDVDVIERLDCTSF